VNLVNRRSVLVGAGGFALGLFATSAAGASWLISDRRPSLTVLGCGSALSVLLTSGGARILLLSGSDQADFGNALSRARYPMLDRVDMMVVAGPKAGIAFVESARQRVEARNLYSLGSADHLLESGIRVDRGLSLPHRFALPGGAALTLPATVIKAAPEPGGWAATVEWKSHRIVIDSGLNLDAYGGLPLQPSVWIRVDGGLSGEAAAAMQPSAIIVPAAAISGPDMRALLSEDGAPNAYGYRVHAGDIAKVHLTSSGIELPQYPTSQPDLQSPA